jgi:hypothetical protein
MYGSIEPSLHAIRYLAAHEQQVLARVILTRYSQAAPKLGVSRARARARDIRLYNDDEYTYSNMRLAHAPRPRVRIIARARDRARRPGAACIPDVLLVHAMPPILSR